MDRPIVIRRDCLQLGGDLVVAALLSQIVYWTPRMTRIRHGAYWIAKTREEWMKETGLTLEQYKRSISVLKAKGLVEVRVMRYKGDAISHTRLLQPVSEVNIPTPPPTGWGKTHHALSIHRIQTEKKDLSSVFCKTSFAKDKISSSLESTGSKELGEVVTIEKVIEVKTVGEGGKNNIVASNVISSGTTLVKQPVPSSYTGWLMKATEILKVHQEKVQTPSGSLAAHWKSRMALLGKGFQKPLTQKEVGQLKLLSKNLGGDTKRVVDYAIEHWWKFASEAGAIAGIASFPSEPHIGYLLKHYGVAVNLLRKPTLPPPVPSVAEPVQLIAHPEEAPHQLTPEELTQLLEDFKSP